MKILMLLLGAQSPKPKKEKPPKTDPPLAD